jgi:hypothetical protein
MFNSSCSVATNPESPPGDIFTYRSARTSLHSSSAYLRNGAIHLRESAACIRKLHSESSEGTGPFYPTYVGRISQGYIGVFHRKQQTDSVLPNFERNGTPQDIWSLSRFCRATSEETKGNTCLPARKTGKTADPLPCEQTR